MAENEFDLTVLLDRFDQACKDQQNDAIAKMLSDQDLDKEAISELVMIDLEYRWKGDGKKLCLEDYRSICPALSDGKFPMELILEEFRVRQRWGDQPSLRGFLRRFTTVPDLENALNEIVKELKRLSIRIFRQGEQLYQYRFSKVLLVGRQATGECEPFGVVRCMTRTGKVEKLVMAEIGSREVSRQQLQISFLNRDQVRIANLSSEVVVALQPGGALGCKRTAVVNIPVSMRIAGQEFRLSSG